MPDPKRLKNNSVSCSHAFVRLHEERKCGREREGVTETERARGRESERDI